MHWHGPKNPNAIPQPTGVTLISVPTNVGPSMGPQAVRHEATTHF